MGNNGGSSKKLLLVGLAAIFAYTQFGGLGLIIVGVAVLLMN